MSDEQNSPPGKPPPSPWCPDCDRQPCQCQTDDKHWAACTGGACLPCRMELGDSSGIGCPGCRLKCRRHGTTVATPTPDHTSDFDELPVVRHGTSTRNAPDEWVTVLPANAENWDVRWSLTVLRGRRPTIEMQTVIAAHLERLQGEVVKLTDLVDIACHACATGEPRHRDPVFGHMYHDVTGVYGAKSERCTLGEGS